jgi:hypothetical protein
VLKILYAISGVQMRPIIHNMLHFLIPVIIPYLFKMKNKLRVIIVLCSTIVIDLDHLLANPIYDPNRSSIGFHPLHSYYAIALYFVLLYFPKIRLLAIGLLIHITLDYTDSLFMV